MLNENSHNFFQILHFDLQRELHKLNTENIYNSIQSWETTEKLVMP